MTAALLDEGQEIRCQIVCYKPVADVTEMQRVRINEGTRIEVLLHPFCLHVVEGDALGSSRNLLAEEIIFGRASPERLKYREDRNVREVPRHGFQGMDVQRY